MTDDTVPPKPTAIGGIRLYQDIHVDTIRDRDNQTSELETTPKDRWYRKASVRFYPRSFCDLEDFSELVERNLLAEMEPIPKLFNQESVILTFGSCFADNFRKYMATLNRRTAAVKVPEGLNNTFSILSYIRWGLTGTDPGMEQWYIKTAEGKIRHYLDNTSIEQKNVHKALMNASGFIFTFGMTEIWRDSETGGVFWRGIPSEVYKENRHRFSNSTFEENYANLMELHRLIRQFRPYVPIIFTVSPVTLGATFRNDSAVISDCVSKSILRAAVDATMRHRHSGLYYWPSFEIVRWFGAHIHKSTFTQPDGALIADSSHVSEEIVQTIVKKFVEHTFS